MSYLLGWLGAPPRDTNAAALSQGAESEAGTTEHTVRSAAGADYGMVVAGPDATAGLHAEGSLVAGIVGRPRWTDRGLRGIAESRGHAAALEHAFRSHGKALLEHLRGAFAIAVLDHTKREAFLAIDRTGTEPLIYTDVTDGLVFGSSSRAVARHPSVDDRISPASVYAYTYFHVVPSPWSIHAGLTRLEPAQSLHYRGRASKPAYYWQPDFGRDERSMHELTLELGKRLRTAVARAHPATDTGAFLSGGIDSSTLSGLLGEALSEPARTYSIGFAAPGYDEMTYARLVSAHFGTNHHEYYVTPADVVSGVQALASASDEPFGNASIVAAYYCARLAKEDGIDTLIAGDGGDELFAGNTRYATQRLFSIYSDAPSLGPLKGWFERLVLTLPGRDSIALFRKAKNYVEQARMAVPDQLQQYNLLERMAPADIFAEDFLEQVDTEAPRRLLHETYARADTESTLNRMLYLDWKFTLADNDLRKVAKACQSAGVGVVFPFLDEDLLEFSATVPPELKLKGTQLRYFFKHAMRDFLPREVIQKSKHGFGLPFGVWLSTEPELQQLAYDSLESLRSTGYFKPSFLDDLVSRHRREHAAFYGGIIWVLMALALWR